MVTDYYLDQTTKYVQLLPLDKKGKKDIIKVNLDDIDFVRIKYPGDSSTADYMPVRNAMWPIVGRKGQVRVCLISFSDDRDQNVSDPRAVLVLGKALINIPVTAKNSGVWHSRYLYLLQFINKRYGENFDKKHFKGKMDMFNYILDRENGTPGTPSPQ
jgi:hypothetical protein